MLRMHEISKSYVGVPALRHVDLELTAGSIHALIGKNGAGKSTLMKVLSGVVQPDGGTISIDGEEVRFRGPADAHAAGIAIVHQELSLVPHLSIAENIFLGGWPLRGGLFLDRRHLHEDARAVLARLNVSLDPRLTVAGLSVAEQQFVEIAKALSRHPRMLILDEPTSALGESDARRLLDLLKELAGQGMGIIYISHRLSEIEAVCDRVTVLRNGSTVGETTVGAFSRARIVEMMVGEAVAKTRPAGAARQQVVLEVRNLSGHAFEDVSFDLHAGEVLGIAGLVGAGRTELVRALFGADGIRSGTITVHGKEVAHPSISRMKKLGVAFLPEDRKQQSLVLDLSVRENGTLAMLDRLKTAIGLFDHERERAMVADMVERLDIKLSNPETQIRTLSGGNQQKVVFGKWLATKPGILLLDEPTRGIDVQARAQIFALLHELAREGLAVIFISSEIEEVLEVSDRILSMARGRITATHTAENADLNSLVLSATA
ncbi:MAG: sugar ABC transporter ATP-binding protein [Rhizobiaceae bacterium]|nr:sugar ABC transporter ATP-binding protein [Rhizobiaceae bacterium]